MPDSKTRFYVHGDEHEENTGEYYCASCDSFEPKKHFYENHNSANAKRLDSHEKYKQSLKNWHRISKNKPARFRRPANPVNIES